jgi:hypothetical protein
MITKLKNAAMRATPGPWDVCTFEPCADVVYEGDGRICETYAYGDQKFIALANPQNIIKLISALEIAGEALDEISHMTIVGVRADEKEGRFHDWKDESRFALRKINELVEMK